MKIKIYLLQFLLGLFLTSKPSFAQNNNLKHYFSTRDIYQSILDSNTFIWYNSAGIFQKKLTDKKLTIIEDFSKIPNYDYSSLYGLDFDGSIITYSRQKRNIKKYCKGKVEEIDTLRKHDISVFFIDKQRNQYFIFGNDTLIIKTKNGIKQFTKIGLTFSKEKTYSNLYAEFITNFHVNKNQDISLVTSFGSVFYFDEKEGKFIKVDTDEYDYYKSKRIKINSVVIDNNRNIWVSQFLYDVIGKYNIDSSSWYIYSSVENDKIVASYYTYIDDNDDKIFWGGGYGALKFDNKDWSLYSFGDDIRLQPVAYLGNGLIISSDYRLDSLHSKKYNQGIKLIEDICPLKDNAIHGFIKDTDNSIWFNTMREFCHFKNGKWETYWSMDLGQSNTKYINEMIVDKEGNRWFATSTGLMKFKGRTWKVYDRTNIFKESDFIAGIKIDNKNNFWVATSKNLFKFENDSLTKISDFKSNIYQDFEKMETDRLGNIFLKMRNAGLWYKYDGSSWCVVTDKVTNNRVNFSSKDDNGELYYRWSNEIYKYENDLNTPLKMKIPIFKDAVLRYYKVIKGDLWSFYSNDLIIQTNQKGEMKVYRNPVKDEKMGGDFYYSVLIDKYDVWLGGIRGLFNFSLKKLEKVSMEEFINNYPQIQINE